VRSPLALALAFNVFSAFSAACASTDEPAPRVFDPYVGPEPYPNLRPKLALPDGDFALVPSSGSDTLALLDLASGTAVGSAPLGRDPVAVDGPHQVIADRARGVAYAVLSYPGSAQNAGQHSHGASNVPGWVQVVALDDLRAVGELRVDPNPGEIALSDDGQRLVVTHFDLTAASNAQATIDARRSSLAVVDPRTIQAFGTPEPDKLLVCVAPHGVTLSRPDGAKAFVACYGEDAVAIVDLVDTNAPVVRVPVAPSVVRDPAAGAPAFGPYAVALSGSGARVAVSNRDAKELRFLDVARSAMEPLVVPLLGSPYFSAWSADGAKVFVPTRGLDAIAVVDASNGAVLRTKVFDGATCVQPLEAIVGVDPSVLFVVCEGNGAVAGAVVTLDASSLEVRARTLAGMSPGRSFVGRGR
jgi:DNA-binding beta-propeller fold protein YncE